MRISKFIKKASKEEIIKLIEMIYPIFAKDFHLKNEIIDKESISNAIKVLQSKEILVEDKAGNIMPPAENSLFFQNYIALSNLCEPSLKRFYIVMSTIWKSESILKMI
jgi:glycerol-3-phosphate O-acyltransferase